MRIFRDDLTPAEIADKAFYTNRLADRRIQ